MATAGRPPDEPGAESGLAPFAARVGATPFVGRAGERAALDDALGRAAVYHSPQLVVVVGQAGVGKSRLVGEWLRSLAEPGARVEGARVLRASARAGDPAYALFARLLRDRFAIAAGDSPAAAAARVRPELEAVFGDRRVADVIHFLGRYVDVEVRESPLLRALVDDPRHHEAVGRTVLRRIIELDAARSPLVVALDDLHLADDESLALLTELVAAIGGSPVAVVAAARPELYARRPDFGRDGDTTRVEVGPLPRPDAERLLRQLLARLQIVPPSLVDDACESTGGNPRLLEELVQKLHAEGAIRKRILVAAAPAVDGAPPVAAEAGAPVETWQIDVLRARSIKPPLSVEDAVATRVGALSLDERDLLEKAATFGNVFWEGALVCLRRLDRADAPSRRLNDRERVAVAAQLAGLVERDYLLALPDSSIAGESELAFKHNLERELLARLTAPERARRHHLFGAQWLETRLEGRAGETVERVRRLGGGAAGEPVTVLTEEQLEFLAQLYERGGAPRRAAQCWFSAGDLARGRYANAVAADAYQRGLALVDRDDALERLEALHNLGDVLALTGRTREGLALFEEMLRAAWLLDHPAKAGAAHGRIGRSYRALGEYDRAEHHLGLALDLFTRARDERGVAGAEDDLGRVSYLRGYFREAEERYRRALELRQTLGDPRSIALTLHNLGQVAHAAGDLAEAASRLEQALTIRRAIGDRSGVAHSLLEVGAVWRDRGEHARALEVLEEGLAHARESGDRAAEARLLVGVGEALGASWRASEAAELYAQAQAVAAETGDRVVQADAARHLCEARVGLGDLAAAREHAGEALELAERIGSRLLGALAERAYATLLGRSEHAHERAEADEHFRAAVERLAEMGAQPELAATLRAHAAYLETEGRAGVAQALRERAEEIEAQQSPAVVAPTGT